ncbi:MAG: hypothetical protein NZ846_11855, partial [Thermus sp.]|nr:hypothetical protein [Thermus sp.]
MRRTLALLFPLCLAPGLAFDWLSGLDWGGITQNVGRVGEVLRCDPGSLAQLDFSQPSLVFRGVYR